MKAAVISQFKQEIRVEDVATPEPGPGEVLVRVRASGLCGTDQHILDGRISTVRLPHIPGHEGAGEVAALGEGVTRFTLGQRVVAAIYVTCGRCYYCLTGQENMCEQAVRIGFERPGSHAEYMLVPAQNLFSIPENVSFETAAVTPDAVACMLHAIRQKAKVQAGQTVVILGGTGGLGMQGIQILKLMGVRVIIASRNDNRLAIAAELGADHLINVSTEDWVAAVRRLTRGRGADVVIDNVGLSETVDQAVSAVRRAGRVVVVGYLTDRFTASLITLFMNEIEVVGCRASTRQDLVDVLQWTAEGRITPYVSRTYALSEINQGLEDLAAGKFVGRSVLIP